MVQPHKETIYAHLRKGIRGDSQELEHYFNKQKLDIDEAPQWVVKGIKEADKHTRNRTKELKANVGNKSDLETRTQSISGFTIELNRRNRRKMIKTGLAAAKRYLNQNAAAYNPVFTRFPSINAAIEKQANILHRLQGEATSEAKEKIDKKLEQHLKTSERMTKDQYTKATLKFADELAGNDTILEQFKGFETISFLARGQILQDVLDAHDAYLNEADRIAFATEQEDIEHFHTNPIIKTIVEADEQLAPLFEKYNPTPNLKRASFKRYLYGSPHNSFERIEEILKGREEEEEKPEETQTPAAAPKESFEQQVGKLIQQKSPSISSAKLNEAKNGYRKLVKIGMLENELLEKVREYSGNDFDSHAKGIRQEITANEAYRLRKPAEKEAPKPVEQKPKPVETKPFSTEELLEKLDTAKRVSVEDITDLKKRLTSGEIPGELHQATLRHLILHELAQGGKTIKITSDFVAPNLLPIIYKHAGNKVVEQLIKEGHIVNRDNGRTPAEKEKVRASDSMLIKYPKVNRG